MSLQGIYDAAQAGYWENEDETVCGCNGKGWFLSDVDTWHKCPYHRPDAPHPEDDSDDDWCEKHLIKERVQDPDDPDIPF